MLTIVTDGQVEFAVAIEVGGDAATGKRAGNRHGRHGESAVAVVKKNPLEDTNPLESDDPQVGLAIAVEVAGGQGTPILPPRGECRQR